MGEAGVGEGSPLELGRELMASDGARREFESLEDELVLKSETRSPEVTLPEVTLLVREGVV